MWWFSLTHHFSFHWNTNSVCMFFFVLFCFVLNGICFLFHPPQKVHRNFHVWFSCSLMYYVLQSHGSPQKHTHTPATTIRHESWMWIEWICWTKCLSIKRGACKATQATRVFKYKGVGRCQKWKQQRIIHIMNGQT